MIDLALNATFSVFQVSDEDFARIFPDGRDMEFFEDFLEREEQAGHILDLLWSRPILKSEALGIHGTLFEQFDDRRAYFPATFREVNLEESSNKAD